MGTGSVHKCLQSMTLVSWAYVASGRSDAEVARDDGVPEIHMCA